VGAAKGGQGADHEAGGDEQREGEGDLTDDEDVAGAGVTTRGAGGGAFAQALLRGDPRGS
jgi:hypothetical protein